MTSVQEEHTMPRGSAALDAEVLVIGAGIAGIGLAIELRRRGLEDFLILEKADDIGGTWRDHTYPGLTVDIPCLTFSFSYEPRHTWSSIWATQPEVLDYLQHCVRKYGVRPHVRFGEEVLDSTYDVDRNVWVTRVRGGRTYTTRYLVNGSGYFSEPRMPDIPGLDRFTGPVVHTSAWRDDVDLDDKRIGFVGTGATAIQLAPEIAPRVGRLHMFQRTPVWLLPKPKLVLRRPVKWALGNIPGLQRAARLLTFTLMDVGFYRVYTNFPRARRIAELAQKVCHKHIRKQVDDPELQRKLTPSYTWGCKRPSFSNSYFAMYNRDNVELVTDSIERIEPDAIVTADGKRREIDVLICATGYTPFEKSSLPTCPVYGRDGVDLREHWDRDRYQAYRGFAVHGYPNFFLIFGPYAINGTSYFAMVEVAVRHIVTCLEAARDRDADYVEVSKGAQAREFAAIQGRKPRSLFAVADCGNSNTFYVDRFGDSPGFRPWLHPRTWLESRFVRMSDFIVRRRAPKIDHSRPLATARES